MTIASDVFVSWLSINNGNNSYKFESVALLNVFFHYLFMPQSYKPTYLCIV